MSTNGIDKEAILNEEIVKHATVEAQPPKGDRNKQCDCVRRIERARERARRRRTNRHKHSKRNILDLHKIYNYKRTVKYEHSTLEHVCRFNIVKIVHWHIIWRVLSGHTHILPHYSLHPVCFVCFLFAVFIYFSNYHFKLVWLFFRFGSNWVSFVFRFYCVAESLVVCPNSFYFCEL